MMGPRSELAPPKTAAHRVGPVEIEPLSSRPVQRCLRCDLLLIVVNAETKALKVGRRVYIEKNYCPGGIGLPKPIEYEDDK